MSRLCVCRLMRWSMRSWRRFPWAPVSSWGRLPPRLFCRGAAGRPPTACHLTAIAMHVHHRIQTLSRVAMMLPIGEAASCLLQACDCA